MVYSRLPRQALSSVCTPTMELIDTRRLTGPNLLWNKPGALLEIQCEPQEVIGIINTWQATVKPMLEALGWGNESTCSKALTGGVSLAFSAPIDTLYSAVEVNEWAWQTIDALNKGEQPPDFEQTLDEIRVAIKEECNPALLALENAAIGNDISFLWDDDDVSVGLGEGSQTWPFRELPEVALLDWQRFQDIPVAIVTGTNGKTTTVRLATYIMQNASRNVGVSCTDWIAVNDEIIERGDWSGPGGARAVLRQPSVDTAVLEAARGGLLRRGLGVNKADAALITNIAEDHLGDYGSRNLNELLEIKWVVSRAVEAGGVLILNADDALLVDKASHYHGTIVWFSLDSKNKLITHHVANKGLAFVLAGNELLKISGEEREVICRSEEIPITLEGAARHNIANALAAAALTSVLGVSAKDIRRGVMGMSQDDNPGRCMLYDVEGFKVLVDFAHNPHAMQALFDMAGALPAKRRLLAFGQAGDRPDELIGELVRRVWSINLERVLVSELAEYHRGRDHGEVFEVIKNELIRCGASENQVTHFEEEMDAMEEALAWARPGDLIIILALGDRLAILERLDFLSCADQVDGTKVN